MYKATKTIKLKNGLKAYKDDIFELEAIYNNTFNIGKSKVELRDVSTNLVLSVTHDIFNQYFVEVDL